MRIFAPSTRMVRFTGEFDFPVKFVKYYKGEPKIVLNKDDVLVLPAPTAMKVSRKSNFELVTFEEQAEMLGQSTTEAEAEAKAPEIVITKVNIMDESLVTLQMIKDLCKQHKITIGKKKRVDLVSLLLPFLG